MRSFCYVAPFFAKTAKKSYLFFWLLVGLGQDEVDVDAEVVLGEELVRLEGVVAAL